MSKSPSVFPIRVWCRALLWGAGSLTLSSGVPPVSAQTPVAVRPAYPEWTTYLNPELGYEVPIPPGVRAQTNPRVGSRCRFSSPDGALSFRVWGESLTGSTQSALDSAWFEATNQKARRIGYQRRNRSGFILSGENRDGTAFHEQVVAGNRALAGMTVVYPLAMSAGMAPLVQEMARGFGWPAREDRWDESGFPPPPPNRGFFSGIRNYFSGADGPPSPTWQDRDDDPLTGPQSRPGFPPPDSRSLPDSQLPPSNRSNNQVDLTPPPPPRAPEPPARTDSASPSRGNSTADRPAPAKREDLPFGIPIPGKKGYVYSPFSDKQQVDVSGIPTGTKVKCPYTSKVFRVP